MGAALAAAGLFSGVGGAVAYKLDQEGQAELSLHAPHLPWSHSGNFDSLDHASIRRGYQVYKQVCAACHSMRYLAYRNLVDISHTEEEAKKEAEEIQTLDGPDEAGNMFMRPGKLADYFPRPFANDAAASSPLAGTEARTMFTICSTDTAILQLALSSGREGPSPTSLVALSAWAHRSTTRSSSMTTTALLLPRASLLRM